MHRTITNQNGAALVEFAIILPVLVILVCGTIEMSLLLYNKQVLTNATREGARCEISKYAEPDIAKNTVVNYCSNMVLLDLAGNSSVSESDVVISDDGGDVSVSLTYDYHYLFASVLGLTKTSIVARTTMRSEAIYGAPGE